MRFIFILLIISSLFSCATSSNTTTSKDSASKEAYYQDLERNIVRLHHLLQGTFTTQIGNQTKAKASLTVSGGDSIVLYSVPLGEVDKDGYWIYSYEFMTSLPDAPIYTSIKHLEQINKDTVDVYYYSMENPVKIQLIDLLELNQLNEKINLEKLIKRHKRVRYVRQSSSHFIGKSLVYEDPDRPFLRQNIYDVSPSFYHVETTFYDKENHQAVHIKKRPNLLVRRSIASDLLHKLAEEG